MQKSNEQPESPRRFVKVMPEYTSTGLWNTQGANLEESEVPMSAALLNRLRAWCAWYERNDEHLPMPDRKFDLDAFSAEGLKIAQALKAELPDWTVVYFDEAKLMASMRARPKERSFYEYEVTAVTA
jgi:hypothetical protein